MIESLIKVKIQSGISIPREKSEEIFKSQEEISKVLFIVSNKVREIAFVWRQLRVDYLIGHKQQPTTIAEHSVNCMNISLNKRGKFLKKLWCCVN